MSTVEWLTGAEHGRSPIASGGGLGNSVVGTPAVNATAARTGSYGLEFTVSGTAASNYIRKNLATPNKIAATLYFKCVTAPSVTNQVLVCGVTAGAVAQVRWRAADNKIEIGFSSGYSVMVNALSTGTWYRLDVKVDVSANPSTMTATINGADSVTATLAQAATTLTYAQIGINPVGTGSFYYDDLLITNDSLDYPIGEVKVGGISPSADGTHNAGTNTIEDNTGADIGTATAFDKLNSVPIGDTTNYIMQSTAGSSNYAEVNFADTTESTIKGALALLAYRAATATADNGGTIIRDSAGTETTVWGNGTTPADYSENSVFYKSAVIGVPTGGWSQTEINALKGRVGYSTDVNPVPWWADLFIEYAYVPSSSTPISVTDNGAGADAISSISMTGTVTDSGSGADTPSIAADVTVTDSGSGADAVSWVGVVKPADSGSGADAVGVTAAVPVSDTGAGAEAIDIAAALSVADSGAGADAISISVSLSVADTGAGAETVSSSVPISIADTGSGADNVTVAAAVPVGDMGAGTDTIAGISATIPVLDTGTGVEAISSITVLLTLTDTGSGLDAPAVGADIQKLVTDLGAGSDAIQGIEVSASVTDSGTGMDQVSVEVAITIAENAQGIDLISDIIANLTVAESGFGLESVSWFDPTRKIIKIAFSLAKRTIGFSMAVRSMNFGITARELGFTQAERAITYTGFVARPISFSLST